MAMESPGFANQASSYSAEVTRRAVFSAYARTTANNPGILAGGLLSAADMQLSAPGSGLSVNVSTGEAIVGGSEGGTQGGYYARNASTTNLAISTANPTNPRIDTVCVTIADTGYTEPTGVSGNAAVLQVVTGTPTSGANLTNLSGKAALPLSSLLLGYVLVPAGASNIITADIANVVTLAAPGLNIPGRVLARQFYAPGSETTLTIATGSVGLSTGQTLDSTNLTVSFAAPSSGAVIVRLQAFAVASAGNYQVWYVVTHGTSTVKSVAQIATGGSSTTGAMEGAATVDALVTGLSPGTSLQWDWAATSSASASCSISAGPGNGAHNYGAAAIEIIAA